MPTLWQDLRYGIRGLGRNPGFTVIAVLVLAAGIGANSAIFSVVQAILLRPLPYPNSFRLVVVWDQLRKLNLNQFPASFANYFDYKAQNGVFEDLAAFQSAEFNLVGGDQPERLAGIAASANLLPMLGVNPVIGRPILPEENEPGSSGVVLLSHALWQRRFGGDRKLIGATVKLDGNPFTVIGVLPPGFRFPLQRSMSPDIFVPVVFPNSPHRTAGNLQLIARLKPGVSVEQAQADLKNVAGRIEQAYRPYRGPKGEDAGYGAMVVSLREQLYGGMRQRLLVLLGAVALVLLIACANVANLLLARAAARSKEMAIRRALGAGSGRLARQLLTEGVLLALLGGMLGLLLAYWGVDVLVALSPDNVPLPDWIGIDPGVLVFTLLVSIGTGLVFGLASVLPTSRTDLHESLRGSGAASLRIWGRQWLATVEVALSLVLAIGAGLLLESFRSLQNVNPGFEAESLLTMRVSLPRFKYRENYQVTAFYKQLLEGLASMPGVKSASLVSWLPLTAAGRGGDPFSIEGRPYDTASKTPQIVHAQVVGLNYFQTMQIPLLAGRHFSARDLETSAPVVIINETMGRGFWPQGDPIGKRILLGAPRPGAAWLTIAGVAGDVRTAGLDVEPLPQMYTPHSQNPARSMTLVIRAVSADGAAAVHRQVAALDKDQPVYDVKTMEQRLLTTISQPRFQTLLLAGFAALAMALAAAGVYGLVSYAVERRTSEIGIRMALGARPAGVVRLVVGQGMAPVLAGVIIGLAGAAAASRALSSLLFRVSPTDAATYAAAALLVTVVGLAACYLPARRSARIDPADSLRYQ